MAKAQLQLPCLALVTDRRLCQEPRFGSGLASAVAEAVAGGVRLVQLREKDLPSVRLLALARELRAVTAGRALLVVNDRLDVALAADADGVHLPEEGLPVVEARRLAGPDFLIGRSVHSVEGARRAQQEGADYVIVGTIFASRSHPGAAPAGLALVHQAVEEVSIPVLAIGGISAANVGEAMQAGAAGAAVISAILAAPEPEAAARELLAAMKQAAVAVGGEDR